MSQESLYTFAKQSVVSIRLSTGQFSALCLMYNDVFGESLCDTPSLFEGGCLPANAVAKLGYREEEVATLFKEQESELVKHSASAVRRGLQAASGSASTSNVFLSTKVLSDGNVQMIVQDASMERSLALPFFLFPVSTSIKGLMFFSDARIFSDEMLSRALRGMLMFASLADLPDEGAKAIERHLIDTKQQDVTRELLAVGSSSEKPKRGKNKIVDVGERVEGARKHKFEGIEKEKTVVVVDDSPQGIRQQMIEAVDALSKMTGETSIARIGSAFFRLAEDQSEENVYFFPHGIVALRKFETNIRYLVDELRDHGIGTSKDAQRRSYLFGEYFVVAPELGERLRDYFRCLEAAFKSLLSGFESTGVKIAPAYSNAFASAIPDSSTPLAAQAVACSAVCEMMKSQLAAGIALAMTSVTKASDLQDYASADLQLRRTDTEASGATFSSKNNIVVKLIEMLGNLARRVGQLAGTLSEPGELPIDRDVRSSAVSWEVFLLKLEASKKADDLPELRILKDMVKRKAVKDFVRKSGVDVSDVVDAESFRKKFGLRSVGWGQYVGASKREDLLYRGAASLADLALTLGIEIPSISLNGSLALAFGERGSGSACATYRPGEKQHIINMTRDRGDGSLAHEWLHALDFGGKQSGVGSLNAGARQDLPGEIRDRMQELRVALQTSSKEDFIARRQAEIASVAARANDCLDRYRAMTLEIKDKYSASRQEATTVAKDLRLTYEKDPSDEKKLAWQKASDALDSIVNLMARDILRYEFLRLRGNSDLDFVKSLRKEVSYVNAGYSFHELMSSRTYAGMMSPRSKKLAKSGDIGGLLASQPSAEAFPSKFSEDMASLDGGGKPYYTTPHEMAAFSFEAYIARKMRGLDMENNYLVDLTAADSDKHQGLSCYPTGAESVRVDEAFDSLIAAFKKHALL